MANYSAGRLFYRPLRTGGTFFAAKFRGDFVAKVRGDFMAKCRGDFIAKYRGVFVAKCRSFKKKLYICS